MTIIGPPGEVGPRVGERFPEVTLPDQNGNTISLYQLLKGGKALVVFHRSALW